MKIFQGFKPLISPQIINILCVLCNCTTFHRYPIFGKRYSVLCKVYTGYCGTSEIEHGLCACTVDNPLAKARGLSLRTGAHTMLYLPLTLSYVLSNFDKSQSKDLTSSSKSDSSR